MPTLDLARCGAAAFGTIAILFASGCSASETAGENDDAVDEGALAAQMTSGDWGFADAVAMEFERARPNTTSERLAFGTKLKVDNFFRLLEPITPTAEPNRSGERCMPGLVRFELFDAKGKVVGVGEGGCRSGYVIDNAHKTRRFFITQAGSIFDGPMVPTDLFWQIDEVHIKEAGGGEATFKAGSEEVAKAVASVRSDARITQRNVSELCSTQPNGESYWRARTVTYFRRGFEVARIGYGCGGAKPPSAGDREVVADLQVLGRFGPGEMLPVERVSGTVPFDPTWVDAVLASR